MKLRNKIQELMKQKNISIASLARKADLSYGTVFYFLNGKSQMTANNVEKLFEILTKEN